MWGFWGWQAYVETSVARRRCSGWLLAGTIPVLITGLGQMLLGWQGPWSIYTLAQTKVKMGPVAIPDLA